MYDAKVLLGKEPNTTAPEKISLNDIKFQPLQNNLLSLYENMRLLKVEVKQRPADDEFLDEMFNDFFGYALMFFELMSPEKKKEVVEMIESTVKHMK